MNDVENIKVDWNTFQSNSKAIHKNIFAAFSILRNNMRVQHSGNFSQRSYFLDVWMG